MSYTVKHVLELTRPTKATWHNISKKDKKYLRNDRERLKMLKPDREIGSYGCRLIEDALIKQFNPLDILTKEKIATAALSDLY